MVLVITELLFGVNDRKIHTKEKAARCRRVLIVTELFNIAVNEYCTRKSACYSRVFVVIEFVISGTQCTVNIGGFLKAQGTCVPTPLAQFISILSSFGENWQNKRLPSFLGTLPRLVNPGSATGMEIPLSHDWASSQTEWISK